MPNAVIPQLCLDDIADLSGRELLFDAGQDGATMQISTIYIVIALVLKKDGG